MPRTPSWTSLNHIRSTLHTRPIFSGWVYISLTWCSNNKNAWMILNLCSRWGANTGFGCCFSNCASLHKLYIHAISKLLQLLKRFLYRMICFHWLCISQWKWNKWLKDWWKIVWWLETKVSDSISSLQIHHVKWGRDSLWFITLLNLIVLLLFLKGDCIVRAQQDPFIPSANLSRMCWALRGVLNNV